MKKENEYEIGDLVIMLVDKYNTIGAFISEEIKHLEGSCK